MSAAERMANDRKLMIQREILECKHFTGIHHDVCKAGVNYRQIVGGPDRGWVTRLPCGLSSAADSVECDKIEHRTPREAEANVDAMELAFTNHHRARRAAHDDAKQKKFGKGQGGADSVPCPVCTTGRLYYRVAAYNGHMHAKCETEGCVSWME